MAWITPFTDRTSAVQYTYTDLNRVGNDLQYLADLLNSYGYSVTVLTKTDYAVGEKTNTATLMTRYITDLNAIKTVFYGTQSLPSSMNNINYVDANNIEKLLVEINTYITNMTAAFWHCGMLNSAGQGGLIV